MATPFDQSTRPLRLAIEGVDPTTIMLTKFEGKEEISRLYAFKLEFITNNDTPLKFEDVLGKPTIVSIDQGEGRVRFFHGLISKLSQGSRDDRFLHYQAELVPPLWMLTQVKRSRIFQDDEQRKATDIIKVVIGGLYTPDKEKVTQDFPERNFTVQYRETDFNFLSRIMEEEGIFYYFSHTDKEHGLILGDEIGAHKDLPVSTELLFDENAADLEGDGRITRWLKSQVLRVNGIQLTDHNFELPRDRLDILTFPIDTADVGTITHKLSLDTMSNTGPTDHPGGYAWWLDGVSRGGSPQANNLEGLTTENARVANLMAEETNTDCLRISGESTIRWLTPGYKFNLLGHFDADGPYYLVSVEHKAELGPDASSGGGGGMKYENKFECLPLSIWFRPKRITEKPTIRGTQTAVVVGSENAEIDPDLYGRVKVHFRWDPRSPRHLDTSCWVRVAQFWAGKQWGAQFIPRVGDEVVVAFVEGDPDRPIIIGSVYNADNMPIFPLPDNKTKSGIHTTSSTKGTTANYNELFFDDKKGAELIGIHAENNMSTSVENNYSLSVGSSSESSGSDVKQYGKSTTQVYGDTSLSVTNGDYSITVGKGKMSTLVSKTIEVESQTDFIHLKSPTQINFNVNGTAKVDVLPGQIKLSVGESTSITMTNDTITIQAAHIVMKGTADIKIETPDMDAKGDKSYYHGATMDVHGTTSAVLHSPTVDVTAGTTATVSGGGSGKLTLAKTAKLEGTVTNVEAGGITTVKGSMVKVNC